MFYIYADDKPIYDPFDDERAVYSAKITLELGKAGSFQFTIPKTNVYYNNMEQLKTRIVVTFNDKYEIFRGRVLSVTRSYDNAKTIYCEGILAYLVDSVQKATTFNGTAKDLFKKIVSRHNALMGEEEDAYKKFTVGNFGIENAKVVIPGKKEDDDAYYGSNEYEQAVIESINDEWLTSYDFINDVLIDYLGGYLVARYDEQSGINYLDIVSTDDLDQKIEQAKQYTSTPTIEFGVNLIDVNEEVKGEDVFTVMVPLGDDNLTIKDASSTIIDSLKNNPKYSKIHRVKINNKNIGLEDADAVRQYGRIVKSHAFSNVNNTDTLYEDAVKYLANHKNIPTLYTIKAVDMAFINSSKQTMRIGEVVRIISYPHSLDDLYLACTRIEYDLDKPENTRFTFGNPEQTLTERYKRDKDKESKESKESARKGGGAGGAAAGAKADAVDERLDNTTGADLVLDPENGKVTISAWCKGAAEGATAALAQFTMWCTEEFATQEMLTTFETASSKASTSFKQEVTENYAKTTLLTEYHKASITALAQFAQECTETYATQEMLTTFTTASSSAMASFKQEVTSTYAKTSMVTEFYEENKGALASFIQYCSGTYATQEMLTKFSTDTSTAFTEFEQRIAGTYASQTMLTNYTKFGMDAIAKFSQYCSETYATQEMLTTFNTATSKAQTTFQQIVKRDYAEQKMVTEYQKYNIDAMAQFMQHCCETYATQEMLTTFTTATTKSTAKITQLADKYGGHIEVLAKYVKTSSGTGGEAKLELDGEKFWGKLKTVTAYKEGDVTKSVAEITELTMENMSILNLMASVSGTGKKAKITLSEAFGKAIISLTADEIVINGSSLNVKAKALFNDLYAEKLKADTFGVTGKLIVGSTAESSFNGNVKIKGSLMVDGGIKVKVGGSHGTSYKDVLNHKHSVTISTNIGHTHKFTHSDGSTSNTQGMSAHYDLSVKADTGDGKF